MTNKNEQSHIEAMRDYDQGLRGCIDSYNTSSGQVERICRLRRKNCDKAQCDYYVKPTLETLCR